MTVEHSLFCPTGVSHQLYLLLPLKVWVFFHESTKTYFLTPFLTTTIPGVKSISACGAEKQNPAPCKSAQVQEQKLFTEHLDLLTCVGIKPENSMHHLYPTETRLDCKEGKFGEKPINFRLCLGVLRCCSGQAAKTAEGMKLLSS